MPSVFVHFALFGSHSRSGLFPTFIGAFFRPDFAIPNKTFFFVLFRRK